MLDPIREDFLSLAMSINEEKVVEILASHRSEALLVLDLSEPVSRSIVDTYWPGVTKPDSAIFLTGVSRTRLIEIFRPTTRPSVIASMEAMRIQPNEVLLAVVANAGKMILQADRDALIRDLSFQNMGVARTPVGVNCNCRPNSPCPCGSGRKYKKCCGAIVQGGNLHPNFEVMSGDQIAKLMSSNPPTKVTVTLSLAPGMPMPLYVPKDYGPWIGKCQFAVNGWDNDSRPIWVIDEAMDLIRNYLRSDPAFPALLDVSMANHGLHLLCIITGFVQGAWRSDVSPLDPKGATITTDFKKTMGEVLIPASTALIPRIGEKASAEWLRDSCAFMMAHFGRPQEEIDDFRLTMDKSIQDITASSS